MLGRAERASQDNENINWRLADALFRDDTELFDKLIDEAMEKGLPYNKTSLNKFYAQMETGIDKPSKKFAAEQDEIYGLFER